MKRERSRQWKRLLSLVLAVVMAATLCLPVSASAATKKKEKPDMTKVELAVGDQARLEVLGWYEKTLWTSADEEVAAVDENGLVTAAGEGTAIVTGESHLFRGRLKVRTNFTITVGAAREPVRVVAGETVQLKGAAGTQWVSADPETVTVGADGLVTGVKEGNTAVTATAKASRFPLILRWGNLAVTTIRTYEVAVVNRYTVTFETNGGSAVEPQTVETGLCVTEPEAPVKENFSFGGWYTDAELTEAYVFATPVSGDLTLYAKWVQAGYTVTFHTNGGSEIPAQQVEPGAKVQAPADPTREGFRLVAWYSDEAMNDVYDFDAPVQADLNLYAKWEELQEGENGYLDEDIPPVEIYSFTTDTWDIEVGTTKTVTFTAEIFAQDVLGAEDISVVDNAGNLVGYMNDAGTAGDAAAEDGIYTLAVDMTADAPKTTGYQVKCADMSRGGVTIGFYQQHTAEELNEMDAVMRQLDELMKPYLDKEGNVIESTRAEAMTTLTGKLDELKASGTVANYTVTGNTVRIELSSGLMFFYAFHKQGTDSVICSYQPAKNTYPKSLQDSSDVATDYSARRVAANVKNYTFNSDTTGYEMNTSADHNFDKEEVDLEAMKNLASADAFTWHGHGGYDETVGSFMCLGMKRSEAIDAQYAADIASGRIVLLTGGGYGITGGFIEKYCGDMHGNFYYLGVCSSAADRQDDLSVANGQQRYELTRAFTNKGATAVIANTAVIDTRYNTDMETDVFARLTEYYTLEESLKYARTENGQEDPYAGEDTPARVEIFPRNDAAALNFRFPPMMGTLSGVVKNAETNRGVENALIRVYNQDGHLQPYQTRTKADGHYEMALPEGIFVLEISAGSYKSAKMSVEVQRNDVVYAETFLLVKAGIKSGYASGVVRNSVTNVVVPDVTIHVRRFWDNTKGRVVKTVMTNQNGAYKIEGLKAGLYTMTYYKSGFATGTKNIVVGILAGNLENQDVLIAPVGSEDLYQAVLTWNENPRDLDSHVSGMRTIGVPFEVYYRNKSYSEDGVEVCNLDWDDTSSYGPETITLRPNNSQPYTYFVHRYSGSGSIATSGAQVKLYKGSELMCTFNAPVNQGSGDYWNVFSIVDGHCIKSNTITQYEDSSYVYKGDTPSKRIDSYNMNFSYGPDLFRTDPEAYNLDLAKLCAALSNAVEKVHDQRDYVKAKELNALYDAMDIEPGHRMVDHTYYDGFGFNGERFGRSVAHKDMVINGIDTTVLFVSCSGTAGFPQGGNEMFLDANFVTGHLAPFGQSLHIYKGIHEYFEAVNQTVEQYKEIHPKAFKKPMKVVITGHSLGGAAANLVAGQFEYLNKDGWWGSAADSNGNRNVYAYTFGSIDGIKIKHAITEDYEYIHNIFNWYDTFGPHGRANIAMKPAGRSGAGRFGHLDVFAHDYVPAGESEGATAPINHLLDQYIRALNDNLIQCDKHCDQVE